VNEPYDFTTLLLTQDVEAAAADVWDRVGGFDQIDRWLDATCSYRSGHGGVGTVRAVTVAGAIYEEVQIARTLFAYTYVPLTTVLPFYHATLSVTPVDEQRCRIDYTFLWDQVSLTDEQRQSGRDVLRQVFQQALSRMKQIAEAD
jgi:uncharacterized protein YndB with AHSA1/START domain